MVFTHGGLLAKKYTLVLLPVMGLPWMYIFGLVAFVSAVTSVALLLYLTFFYVDVPTIKGLPEIPGGELLAGHLYQLGRDHATTAETWATRYGWPAFQLRMGRRRAIMLNSFQSAQEFLVKNQSATLDRPWFYTFHGVVSKTSGQPTLPNIGLPR